MRSRWIIAVATFAILTAIAVATWIVADRNAVIRSVGDRTGALARMIAAHGGAAINDASLIVEAVADDVAAWDLKDRRQGQRIYDRLHTLLGRSPQLSSAWIVDASGVSRLDTWEYPSKPYSAADRKYFKRHLAGAANPVIAGDEVPGVVTGQERFTFSEALRSADGGIHAIIVVAIYRRPLDILYGEAATWPQARAGLYNSSGDTLARLSAQFQASPEFVAKMAERVAEKASGTALLDDRGAPRILGWQRVAQFPDVYATSSQTVSAALAEWRTRSLLLAAVASVAVVAFALFGWMSVRSSEARRAAFLNEMAGREAHHRVKNSLHLLVSMIGLLNRKADPQSQATLGKIARQIRTIADAHDLLQRTSATGYIDLCGLLAQLCESLQLGFSGAVAFTGDNGWTLEAKKAMSAAVVCNELAMNALKHAASAVTVDCRRGDGILTVTVADDGPGLPPDFAMPAKDRFGLRTALLLAQSMGGALTATNGADGGATFRLTIPLSAGDVREGGDGSGTAPRPSRHASVRTMLP